MSGSTYCHSGYCDSRTVFLQSGGISLKENTNREEKKKLLWSWQQKNLGGTGRFLVVDKRSNSSPAKVEAWHCYLWFCDLGQVSQSL